MDRTTIRGAGLGMSGSCNEGTAAEDKLRIWRRCLSRLVCLLLSSLLCACLGSARSIESADREETGRMLADLEKARVLFVGEFHDQRDHHRLQLEIIRHLHRSGKPLVIGFEMFKLEQQNLLDRWVEGQASLQEFVARYLQGWKVNWAEYDEIMLFARNNSIPMVALDAPAELVKSVTRQGVAVLRSPAGEQLPAGTTTDVSPSYRAFLARAFRTHQIPDFMFDNFCAAQGLRNSVMARRIAAYMKENPGRTMVVIAGTGHAMRRAVPSGLAGEGLTMRIVIPRVDGLYAELDGDDMDYLVEM